MYDRVYWLLFGGVLGFALGGTYIWALPRNSLWIPNNPTDLFTLVLAVSTIGLWFSTHKGIRLGRDQFNATHRPQIRLKHIWLNDFILPNEPIVVNLYLANNGSGEAILHQIGVRFDVVPIRVPLPVNPHIDAIVAGNGDRMHSGRNYAIEGVDIGRVISVAEFDALNDNHSDLYCIGYVSYHDAAGRMRITGFCRRLAFPRYAMIGPENSRFLPVNDPDYDYAD
jgi:hypothetical protein